MRLTRRAGLLGLSAASLIARRATATRSPVRISVGVLRTGTISWELDVVSHHGLDRDAEFRIESTEFAATQATQVALQANAVHVIGSDWLWVSRQRAAGGDWTFVPSSTAVGAVVVPKDSQAVDMRDFLDRRFGVAGGPLDKSWLILRAYTQRRYGFDIDLKVTTHFGTPPLLAAEMEYGRLDAVLTYWPFVARAETAGLRCVLTVEDAVREIGIAAAVPFVGYVFSERWAEQNRMAMESFLAVMQDARAILATSDSEWDRLRPLTGAASDGELAHLRDWYRRGIPRRWGEEERDGAKQLFRMMGEIGGRGFIGLSPVLAPGTFWPVRLI